MTDMMDRSVDLFTQRTLDNYKGANPMIIHDNGSQYISLDFRRILFENECIDVPTRRNHPETNDKVEKLLGIIRQESLRPNSPSYYGEAERVIKDFVDYYNTKRYHASIYFLLLKERGSLIKQNYIEFYRIEKNKELFRLLREKIPA